MVARKNYRAPLARCRKIHLISSTSRRLEAVIGTPVAEAASEYNGFNARTDRRRTVRTQAHRWIGILASHPGHLCEAGIKNRNPTSPRRFVKTLVDGSSNWTSLARYPVFELPPSRWLLRSWPLCLGGHSKQSSGQRKIQRWRSLQAR